MPVKYSMPEAISIAIVVLRGASPSLGDEALLRTLVAENVESTLAARLIEFLPIAYCRAILAKSGAQFSDTFMRRSTDGSLREQKFSIDPVWNAVEKFARGELRRGVSGQDLLAIAGRSPEFHAANQLLEKGSELRTLVFAQPIMNWSEKGPIEDATAK